MPENRGQEVRAIVAVVLSMAVLLLWSVLFPPARDLRTVDAPEFEAPTTVEPLAGAETPPGSARESLPAMEAPGATPVSNLDVLRLALDAPTEAVQVRVDGTALSLTLDGRGARVIEAELRGFHEGNGEAVQLLPEGGAGAVGTVVVVGHQRVSLDPYIFRLVSNEPADDGRRVVWELPLAGGTIRKTYTIPTDGNRIQVEHEIFEDRLGLAAWGLSWNGGIRVTEEGRSGASMNGYFFGSVRAEGKVQRIGANKARQGALDYPGHTYFVGVQNKYFLGAIIPKDENQGPARLWQAGDGTTGLAGQILAERTSEIAATRVGYDVYIGPLDYEKLAALGLGLEGTVDLGASWIRPLSRGILGLLIWTHRLIPNYGIVIILFSLAINLAFFPLTYKSTKSMRDMAALKPRLDAIKEKYKNEPQKMSEATMRLYKEAGVNPLAGCLPLILQMPVFFALYAVLFHTIELRQAPFLGWIRDLSQPDVVFHLPFALPFIGSGIPILPIVMGVTSYFQSKQTMVDPSQKMMVVMMPIMMTFIFFSMPSGLVLYWLTSNVFTIAQKFFLKPSPALAAAGDGAAARAGTPPEKPGKRGGRSKRPADATSNR